MVGGVQEVCGCAARAHPPGRLRHIRPVVRSGVGPQVGVNIASSIGAQQRAQHNPSCGRPHAGRHAPSENQCQRSLDSREARSVPGVHSCVQSAAPAARSCTIPVQSPYWARGYGRRCKHACMPYYYGPHALLHLACRAMDMGRDCVVCTRPLLQLSCGREDAFYSLMFPLAVKLCFCARATSILQVPQRLPAPTLKHSSKPAHAQLDDVHAPAALSAS